MLHQMAGRQKAVAYLNGEFLPQEEARISPEDRGFLLGDGVFDTLRTYRGKFFRFSAHADRLFTGLAEVRISAPFDADGLHNILLELIRANGGADAVARITVTRGIGGGGYRLGDGPPTVYASLRALPDVDTLRREGVTLGISKVPRPLPFLSVVKTTSVGAMALARLLDDAYETIMLDADGFVAEGSGSTVYAVRGGDVVTSNSLTLPGITAQVIEELVQVKRQRMTPDELFTSDAIFLASTSTGPIPVRSYENHPIVLKIIQGFDRLT